MLFRNFRIKRQLAQFQEHADPSVLAEEKAALERENAEASSKSSPQLPTPIGAELLGKSYRGFRPVTALKPNDSSWKQRQDYEPEKIDGQKD